MISIYLILYLNPHKYHAEDKDARVCGSLHILAMEEIKRMEYESQFDVWN